MPGDILKFFYLDNREISEADIFDIAMSTESAIGKQFSVSMSNINQAMIERTVADYRPSILIVNSSNINRIIIIEQQEGFNDGLVIFWFQIIYTNNKSEIGKIIVQPKHYEEMTPEQSDTFNYLNVLFYSVPDSARTNFTLFGYSTIANDVINLRRIFTIMAGFIRDLYIVETVYRDKHFNHSENKNMKAKKVVYLQIFTHMCSGFQRRKLYIMKRLMKKLVSQD